MRLFPGRWDVLRILLAALCIALMMPCPARAATLLEGIATHAAGDFAEAFRRLQPLAEAGHPEAEWYLGLMRVRGEGTPLDYAEAMHWFLRAAGHGHARAFYDIGVMHELGEGRPVDHAKARQWYERGLRANCGLCKRRLGVINLYGTEGTEPAPRRALQWLREGAEDGDAVAALYLGAGLLSTDDAGAWQEALFHLQRAASRGDVSTRVLWNVGRWVLPESPSDLTAAVKELRTLAKHPDLRPRTRTLLWSILIRSALMGRGMAVDPSQALADAAQMDALVKQLDEQSLDAFENGLRRSFLSFRYAPYFDQMRAILDARVAAQGGNSERACEAAFDLARGVLDGWLGTGDALLALEAVERCPVSEGVMLVRDPNLLLQLLGCDINESVAVCRRGLAARSIVAEAATQPELLRELRMVGLACQACKEG